MSDIEGGRRFEAEEVRWILFRVYKRLGGKKGEDEHLESVNNKGVRVLVILFMEG